jgi:hypothetical protein
MPSNFSTQQNNDFEQILKALLGDTTGLSNTRVSEIDDPLGDGRAYGTFENDPFGLQSGIVSRRLELNLRY